jgi:hypothetical protein
MPRARSWIYAHSPKNGRISKASQKSRGNGSLTCHVFGLFRADPPDCAAHASPRYGKSVSPPCNCCRPPGLDEPLLKTATSCEITT